MTFCVCCVIFERAMSDVMSDAMNYIFNSQNSQSQPLFSPENTQRTQSAVRPSLLLARTQLEQKQKEKNERRRMKRELLRTSVEEMRQMRDELRRKRETLGKLRLRYNQLLEELLASYNEQNSHLTRIFDEYGVMPPR